MRSIYLDTARLGQMSPGAVDALTDFVRLTAEEPSGLYFEQFLRNGHDALPECYNRRFPSLKSWRGISGLKQSLTRLVGSPSDCRVLLASRSSQLMQLAAFSQFRICRRVLTTDLNWPAYQKILRREAIRTGGTVEVVPLRHRLLFDRIQMTELIRTVAAEYHCRGCDGLFLPAVDNLGIRLPIRSIVRLIESRRMIRFVTVDGAQAIGHLPLGQLNDVCDLLVAGCHKWLRAYLPMGLAFFARPRSIHFIEQAIEAALQSRRIDDPLLRFTRQIEAEDTDGYSETTNVSSLLSCAGALADIEQTPVSAGERKMIRRSNVRRILEAVCQTPWTPLLPDEGLRSDVVLLQSRRYAVRQAAPDAIREAFRLSGVSLSSYEAGLIRLSMPDEPIADQTLDQVRDALLSVN
ncbi:aminotransferase class V-fold PLP-dependent enzyme [bacterium]|nr:aminotransferase class V-fold PLP-dependent enzyme [bacterium]